MSRQVKRRMIVVDLDNLYIVDNHVNTSVLRKRINAIHQFAINNCISKKAIWWFGNNATGVLLGRLGIEIPLITINLGKDTADHAILQHLMTRRWKHAFIVSNDQTILSIAWVLFPKKPLYGITVDGESKCHASRINNLCFHKSSSFLKMVESFMTYARRYHPNFLPSS